MATLPEDNFPKHVRRPNGGAEPCVSGYTGRYEIPSKTKTTEAYFGSKRHYFGSTPRSDAPLPYKVKK